MSLPPLDVNDTTSVAIVNPASAYRIAYDGVNQSGVGNGSVVETEPPPASASASEASHVNRSFPIASVPEILQTVRGPACAGADVNATTPRAIQTGTKNFTISVLPRSRDQCPSSWTIANLHPYSAARNSLFGTSSQA